MKKILSVIAFICINLSVSADFMYQEIDPICSISGTTHTSFPGEISDTSSWSIPKAYDGECVETPVLKVAEKELIGAKMVSLFERKGFIKSSNGDTHTLTTEWQELTQNNFFPAVQKYIAREMEKQDPRLRNIAILNYAVSVIGYDYFINIEVKWDDYVGLTLEAAQELAENNNTTLRVTELDGEPQMVTMDYRPGRINASVKNNIVTSYRVE